MGRSPKQLRDELRFLTDFGTLCDVMQQAALSQLAHDDDAAGAAPRVRDFLQRECLPMLPSSAAAHPLLAHRDGRRTIVLLTSNEGLVGPLHGLVARKALALAQGPTAWILIGQRALRLLGPSARGARQMPLPSDADAAAKWHRFGEVLVNDAMRGASSEAVLVAARYVSRSRQEIAVYPLLPLPMDAIGSAPRPQEILLEPSLDAVIQSLAVAWIASTGLEAQASARRAEHAARILHMERARDELTGQARSLRHHLFKTMHTKIDVMVRETCVVHRLAEVRRRAAAGAVG